jgi:membrane associated rhomboid family serine protease
MPRYPRTALAYSFGPGPITPAVRMLLWSNGAIFLATWIFPILTEYLGLIPERVVESRWVWQVATYMFLHDPARVTHILFNMLGLWMFGVELERMWRTKFFVKFYAITGIGAGLISIAVSLLPFAAARATYDVNIIGASGALYGLLLAFALYYPNRPILMFFFFPVPAKYFVAILGAIAFIMSVQGSSVEAATTHLGGLLVAYVYLQGGRGGLTAEIKYRYLKWKMNRLRRKFDVYSGGRSDRQSWDRHVH